MKSKQWSISFLIAAIIAILGIFGFNYSIDPLWVNSEYHLFKKKIYIDEREQKINYIKHQKPSFSNLILGSSRATYVNSNKLGKSWFNLACSGMYPLEMHSYLKWAQSKATEQEIDTVLIVLDFWTLASNAIIDYGKAQDYNDKTDGMYILNSYLSLDALSYSVKTLKINYSPEHNDVYYTWPSLLKNRVVSQESLKENKVKEQLSYYKNTVYGEKYQEKDSYYKELSSLVDSFPQVHFLAYSTPVSNALNRVIENSGKDENQKIWEEKLAQIKGLHFTPLHNQKLNDSLFYDSHHLKPEPATSFAYQILRNK